MEKIIIVGISEFAKKVRQLIEQINQKESLWEIEGCLDDSVTTKIVYGEIRVLGKIDKLKEYGPETCLVCGVENNYEREKIIRRIEKIGKFKFPNLIAPEVKISKEIKIGKGNLIFGESQILGNATIENFTIIYNDCKIYQETLIGSFALIRCGGKIYPKTEVGIAAEVIDGTVVTSSVQTRCSVAGNPARIVKLYGKYSKLLVVGANGHGKAVMELARQTRSYDNIFFLDDNPSLLETSGVLGCSEYAIKHKEEYDVIVAIGNAKIRDKLQTEYERRGVNVVTMVSPFACVATDTKIDRGCVVMAGSVIQPETSIGRGTIINTCTSVDHENKIGDFVHVAVGAHLAGNVIIGNNTWIGAGAVVSNNIEISEDIVVGAGAVVIKNLNEIGTYIGVPARKMKV